MKKRYCSQFLNYENQIYERQDIKTNLKYEEISEVELKYICIFYEVVS